MTQPPLPHNVLHMNKRVTINDIATACNLNKSTISRILGDRLEGYPLAQKTVDRVRATAKEMGYRPNRLARAAREQRTRLIGISVRKTFMHSPADPSEEIQQELENSQQNLGVFCSNVMMHPLFKDYNLMLIDRHEEQDSPLVEADFCTDLIDGMIYKTPSENHSELIEFSGPDFPIVVVDEFPGAREKIPCVGIDNRKVAAKAVTHLIENGRKTILLLMPERLSDIYCIQDRVAGYRDALEAAGIPYRDELVITVKAEPDIVSERIKNLLFLDKIDAIFSPIDEIPIYARPALEDLGLRVPEDIALCGFNDTHLARHAGLTSVKFPEKEIANTAADLLLNILEGNRNYEPGFHEVETELVIRESTVKAES